MKAGDLVIVLYEPIRYYLILKERTKESGSKWFEILRDDGHIRLKPKSELKVVTDESRGPGQI